MKETLKKMIPLVNSTFIDQLLHSSWKQGGQDYAFVKEMMGVEGSYPRWLGVANLTRTVPETQELKSIGTVINLGD